MKLLRLEAKTRAVINHINKTKDMIDKTESASKVSVCFHTHYDDPVLSLSKGDVKCAVKLVGGQLIKTARSECTGVEAYLLAKEFELALSQVEV